MRIKKGIEGKRYKITYKTEEEREVLANFNMIAGIKMTIESLSESLATHAVKAWKNVREIFPETDKHDLTFKRDTQEIIVGNKQQ